MNVFSAFFNYTFNILPNSDFNKPVNQSHTVSHVLTTPKVTILGDVQRPDCSFNPPFFFSDTINTPRTQNACLLPHTSPTTYDNDGGTVSLPQVAMTLAWSSTKSPHTWKCGGRSVPTRKGSEHAEWSVGIVCKHFICNRRRVIVNMIN